MMKKAEGLRAELNSRKETSGRERDMELKGRGKPQREESGLFVSDNPQDDDEFIKID